MSRVIIPVEPGLGDNLLLSTLPEMFARRGAKEIYIHMHPEPGWRNPDIPKLIWETNPYVTGFTLERGNIPVMNWHDFHRFVVNYESNIAGIEAYYGFQPTYQYPQLYNVKFDWIKDLSHKTLVDMTSFTGQYTDEDLKKFIDYLVYFKHISLSDCVVVDPGNVNHRGNPFVDLFPSLPKIKSENIFHYANMIFSCEKFVTVASGGSALASTIKGRNSYKQIYVLSSSRQFNEKIWVFNNLTYFLCDSKYNPFDKLGSDW